MPLPRSLTITRCKNRKLSIQYQGRNLKQNSLLSSSRDIFVTRHYIIKIDEPDKIQTRNEYETFNRISKEDLKYFAKIVHVDLKKGIIIQKRHHFLDRSEKPSKENKQIVRRLIRKYKLQDIYLTGPYNWAVDKNTNLPVIYDLGFCQ